MNRPQSRCDFASDEPEITTYPTLGIDGFHMLGDVLRRGLKQRGDFSLAEPKRAAFGPHFNAGEAVVGRVENEFALAFGAG